MRAAELDPGVMEALGVDPSGMVLRLSAAVRERPSRCMLWKGKNSVMSSVKSTTGLRSRNELLGASVLAMRNLVAADSAYKLVRVQAVRYDGDVEAGGRPGLAIVPAARVTPGIDTLERFREVAASRSAAWRRWETGAGPQLP